MDKATKTKAWKELTKPFAKSVIKKNPKGFGDYVPHHIYTRRLVDSGLLISFDTVEVIRGAEGHVISARCTLVVDSPDGEKTVTACGDVEPPAINSFKNGKKSEGELIKDAESDALKRCCMRLGIGLHMWEQDMSEEEYSSSVDTKPAPKPEVKVEKKPVAKPSKEEQKKMEDTVNEMVPDDDMKARLQQALEFHEKNETLRKKFKESAWARWIKEESGPQDLGLWTQDHFDVFMDMFVEVQSNTEVDGTKDLVVEVFGDVQDTTQNCPKCGNHAYIEDNREKKESDPGKFGAIPDFGCSNWGDKEGCGWGGYINSSNPDKEVPTTWL